MDTKILQDIGLSEGETKVYLALLRLDSTTTGPIAAESGVSASKVYKILDRLHKKGLVGHIIQGKIKYFKAMPPSSIIDYMNETERKLEEKKQEVTKMLPSFEKLISKTQGTEATVYYGFRAVQNLFRNLREELKSGEEYFTMGAKYQEDIPGLREFFYNHHMQRAKKKIFLNMLANADARGNMEKTTLQNADVRYLPQYLMTDMQILFFKETTYIILWKTEPIAFLIKSKEIVSSFRKYFEAFWKIAKK